MEWTNDIITLIIVGVGLAATGGVFYFFKKEEKQPVNDYGEPIMTINEETGEKEPVEPVMIYHRFELYLSLLGIFLVVYYSVIFLTAYPKLIASANSMASDFWVPFLIVLPAAFIIVLFLVVKYYPNSFTPKGIIFETDEGKIAVDTIDVYNDEEKNNRAATNDFIKALNNLNPYFKPGSNQERMKHKGFILGEPIEEWLFLKDLNLEKEYQKIPLIKAVQWLRGGKAYYKEILEARNPRRLIKTKTLGEELQLAVKGELDSERELQQYKATFPKKVSREAAGLMLWALNEGTTFYQRITPKEEAEKSPVLEDEVKKREQH